MLSTRDPPQNKGHILTETERLEKNISQIQKTSNSQSNLEKEEWNWRNQLA